MMEIVAVYSDGGCISKNPSPDGGVWCWCQVDAAGRRGRSEAGLLLPADCGLPAVSNNVAEFWALWQALRALPDGWDGTVASDSQISLGRLFWGWRAEGLPPGWQVDAWADRQRLGTLVPLLLDGHPTTEHLRLGVGKRGHPVSVHNQHCDTECNRVAQEFLKRRKLREWAAR